MARTAAQWRKDSHRKTYELAFPADLDAERVAAWLTTFSGTLKPPRTGFFTGIPTVGFEVWATKDGFIHLLKLPWQYEDRVIPQLHSLVPGMVVRDAETIPQRVWVRAYEAGLVHTRRTLHIPSSANLATSILAAMQTLEGDETLMMQWVVSPAPREHPPIYDRTEDKRSAFGQFMGNSFDRDEVNDRREKLTEPNLYAVVRVAAVANTPIRADHLIKRLKASLAQTAGPSTHFRDRIVVRADLQDRIDRAVGWVMNPAVVSVSELAALMGWPIGNPFITGLPAVVSKRLPAVESVPRDGRVIGRSNFPGKERPIAMNFDDGRTHVHVLGGTGVGKTVLLGNMMKQDMDRGYGVVLIENKGDLFDAAINYVPRSRLDDVIVLDLKDTLMPVGFNVLDQGDNPLSVIDDLDSLFNHVFRDNPSLYMKEMLHFGLRTLADAKGSAFTDLAPLMVPGPNEVEWREQLISSNRDDELRQFWQRIDNLSRTERDRVAAPVMNRVWSLTRPKMRNVLGQSVSSFQMSDVIKDNKILLVNLSGIEKQTASLMGTLLINSIWSAVKTTRSDRPTFLYMDEFQDFLDLPTDPEDMLAKARGFGLGMVLAHQHLAQLDAPMRAAVMTNARSKIIFQCNSEDARDLTREFGYTVSESDFTNLGKYEALARIRTGEGTSPPMTLIASAPARGDNLGHQVRQQSRKVYGRNVADVEESMRTRRSITKPARASRQPMSGFLTDDELGGLI